MAPPPRPKPRTASRWSALLQSLDPERNGEPLRPAFRLELLDAALEPLEGELETDQLDLLKTGLSILIGTEAMIAMRDVLRLDHDEARASGEWAVRQMVRSVRATTPTDGLHPPVTPAQAPTQVPTTQT